MKKQKVKTYNSWLDWDRDTSRFVVHCNPVPWADVGREVWVSLAGHVFRSLVVSKGVVAVPREQVETSDCSLQLVYSARNGHQGEECFVAKIDGIPATVAIGDNFEQLVDDDGDFVALLRSEGLIAIEFWENASFSERRQFSTRMRRIEGKLERYQFLRDWLIGCTRKIDWWDGGLARVVRQLTDYDVPATLRVEIIATFSRPLSKPRAEMEPPQSMREYAGVYLLVNGHYVGTSESIRMDTLLRSTKESLESCYIHCGEPGVTIQIERRGKHVIWRGDGLRFYGAYAEFFNGLVGTWTQMKRFSLGTEVVFDRDDYDSAILESVELLKDLASTNSGIFFETSGSCPIELADWLDSEQWHRGG